MDRWKKVSCLILAAVLCFCLLPVQAANVGGDQGSSGSGLGFHTAKPLPLTLQSNQVSISVNAVRTDAYTGDVITFEVVMDPVQHLGTLQLVLDIPEGLTYVPGSARIPDGLKAALGYDELAFTEHSMMLNGYASAKDYSSAAETLLMTFDCRVDTIVTEIPASMSLTNLEFCSVLDWMEYTDGFEMIPASLTLHPGCLYGDANGDGLVNTRDIVLIRQYVAAKDPYTGISTVEVCTGADANGDGQINTRDVVLVRQYVAAKDPITGESSVVLGPNS